MKRKTKESVEKYYPVLPNDVWKLIASYIMDECDVSSMLIFIGIDTRSYTCIYPFIKGFINMFYSGLTDKAPDIKVLSKHKDPSYYIFKNQALVLHKNQENFVTIDDDVIELSGKLNLKQKHIISHWYAFMEDFANHYKLNLNINGGISPSKKNDAINYTNIISSYVYKWVEDEKTHSIEFLSTILSLFNIAVLNATYIFDKSVKVKEWNLIQSYDPLDCIYYYNKSSILDKDRVTFLPSINSVHVIHSRRSCM